MNHLFASFVDAFISGLFGTIGAATPIVLLLFFLFLKTRKNFQSAIADDKKVLKKYKDNLTEVETTISDIQAQINAGVTDETAVGKELYEIKSLLTEDKMKYEIEIAERGAYIRKIERASFFNWISYYFTRSYLTDYFKR